MTGRLGTSSPLCLESGWHFMTWLHENSKDQLAKADVHWVFCKSLAKPATLVLAIWTGLSGQGEPFSIQEARSSLSMSISVLSQPPTSLNMLRACFYRAGLRPWTAKKELLRAIGMENIAFSCVRQVYILRRRPTKVDKTGYNSTTKRPTALKLGSCLAKACTVRSSGRSSSYSNRDDL